MANNIYSGSEGIVYVGDVAVASIRSFSLEETQEIIDATTMNTAGVAFRTNKPTFKSWSGTVDVFWTTSESSSDVDGFGTGDAGTAERKHQTEQGGANAEAGVASGTANTDGDDALFGILQPGNSEVTLHFWPSGDDTGELGYEGNCLITSRTISSSVDGMIEASVTVTGTAPIKTEVGGYTGLTGAS